MNTNDTQELAIENVMEEMYVADDALRAAAGEDTPGCIMPAATEPVLVKPRPASPLTATDIYMRALRENPERIPFVSRPHTPGREFKPRLRKKPAPMSLRTELMRDIEQSRAAAREGSGITSKEARRLRREARAGQQQ